MERAWNCHRKDFRFCKHCTQKEPWISWDLLLWSGKDVEWPEVRGRELMWAECRRLGWLPASHWPTFLAGVRRRANKRLPKSGYSQDRVRRGILWEASGSWDDFSLAFFMGDDKGERVKCRAAFIHFPLRGCELYKISQRLLYRAWPTDQRTPVTEIVNEHFG